MAMAALVSVVLAGAVACANDRSSTPVKPPPPPAAPADAIAAAKAEFEVVAHELGSGSSKLYSRDLFLPLDDPRGMATGDFLGRLRALFGPVDDDDFTLRHRATGFLVTAYSAQSGPSYGGGCRLPAGASPTAPDAEVTCDEAADDTDGRERRAAAIGPRPVDWGAVDRHELAEAAERPHPLLEHGWSRRLHDAVAPPGFAPVAARLAELVEAVPPVDFETIRWDDEETPIVYVVGVRGGVDVRRVLPVEDGLAYLLAEAERATDHVDARSIHYVLAHAAEGGRFVALLPRVRQIWFRAAAACATRPGCDAEERAELLEQAAGLGIPAAEARTALSSAP
jgi:hypothetical protein